MDGESQFFCVFDAPDRGAIDEEKIVLLGKSILSRKSRGIRDSIKQKDKRV